MDDRNAQLEADLEEATATPDIEGALMQSMETDERLGNGVPDHLRGSDLEFIQMSGLTAPVEGEIESKPPAPAGDMDPSVPVSFYEEGVDDVDSTSEPLGTEAIRGDSDEVIVPAAKTELGSSIASLKEIVADLTAGETQPTGPAEEAAGVAPEPALEVTQESGAPAEPVEALEPEPAAQAGEASDTLVSVDPVAPSEVAMEIEVEAPPIESEAASPDALAADGAEAEAAEAEVLPAAEPEPAPLPAEAAEPALTQDLAGAESLLRRLEDEVRTGSPAQGVGAEDFSLEMPEIPEAVERDDDPESDETVYSRPNIPHRRKGGRRRRSVRRRLVQAGTGLVFLALLCAGAYQAYSFYWIQTASENDVYRQSVKLFERGRYVEAARSFANFADRYPGSPLSAEALFMAARSLETAGSIDPKAYFPDAIAYYERFRQEYPGHAKAQRAATLLGMLHVRTGEYEAAIHVLQRPELRKLDPQGYLGALRGLGEAHAALGSVEQARSAYLRAASLEGNYTADEDYAALAAVYMGYADDATEARERGEALRLAVEQWNFALRSPGITERRRRNLEVRRDFAAEELGENPLSRRGPNPEEAKSLDEKYREDETRLTTID